MGVCLSCFRSDDGTLSTEPTERTPLIQEYSTNSINTGSFKNDAERLDRAKRQQILHTIVGFTGENLIDVTSVSRPEVHTSAKPASEYKRLLLNRGSDDSNSNSSILPILPKMKVLSNEERAWLKGLSKTASNALEQEVPVELPGPLVHKF